jgi:hypothetical protein
MAARKTPSVRPVLASNGQEVARLPKQSEADAAAIDVRIKLLKTNSYKKRLALESKAENQQMDGTTPDGLQGL